MCVWCVCVVCVCVCGVHVRVHMCACMHANHRSETELSWEGTLS